MPSNLRIFCLQLTIFVAFSFGLSSFYALAVYAQVSNDFSFRNGIGYKISGPVHQPVSADGSTYPRAERNNWWQPAYSVDSFSRLDDIWPAHKVRHGQTSALPRWKSEPELRYTSAGFMGGSVQTLDGYFSKNPVTGLLLVKDGQILVERY